MSGDELAQHAECGLDIGLIGHSNGEVQLPDGSEVVQNFSDDFAVRNDDSGMVGMQQSGREDIDLRDISMDPQEGDMFADPVGLCEDNRKPRYHIAQYPLQSQSDTETGDAEARHQRRDLHAELIQRNENPEDNQQGFQEAQEQQGEGRLRWEESCVGKGCRTRWTPG